MLSPNLTNAHIRALQNPLPNGEAEGAELRYRGVSTLASKLIAKQETWILFNQNSTQRETATKYAH